MQQIVLIILLILSSFYLLVIIYYWIAWITIPVYTAKPIQEDLKITIIIPARNEEKNIEACLRSISNQSYPKHLYQVLVVDDHSTDNTAGIINSFTGDNIKLISLKDFINTPINSYKKKAIEIAIQQSTGELIVTTDADCVAPSNWLQTIASFYEEYQPVFIAAPVSINCSFRFIEMFQALDFSMLQGITGASVHKKIHSMCNGANLAYTKKAFEEVGGYADIDSIASGDDMLLMHKIFKRWPQRVMFLKSKEAIITTAPAHSIKAFINQRVRWASKADKYDDKNIFMVLVLVYLVNVGLLLLSIIVLFKNFFFSIGPFQFSFSTLLLCLLGVKSIAEIIFLFPVANFFGKQKLLWFFPVFQPLHILYMVIAGWLGKFGNYSWKERKVK